MIIYKQNIPLTLDQFIEVFRESALGERRPVNNLVVMQQMMDNASLTITAWEGGKLVGIARALTDFGYVAYLADLAVSKAYQGKGIGRKLIEETKNSINSDCMLVLLSAPQANEFYPKVGFSNNLRAWVLDGSDPVL